MMSPRLTTTPRRVGDEQRRLERHVERRAPGDRRLAARVVDRSRVRATSEWITLIPPGSPTASITWSSNGPHTAVWQNAGVETTRIRLMPDATAASRLTECGTGTPGPGEAHSGSTPIVFAVVGEATAATGHRPSEW